MSNFEKTSTFNDETKEQSRFKKRDDNGRGQFHRHGNKFNKRSKKNVKADQNISCLLVNDTIITDETEIEEEMFKKDEHGNLLRSVNVEHDRKVKQMLEAFAGTD